MGLESTHPLYDEFAEDWVQQRDLYRGERVVKAKGEEYLPATQGMHLDGMKAGQSGRIAYEAYKKRAVFPDYIKDGVEALVGLLHQKEPTIELPAALEPLRAQATVNGESLAMLLRRINTEQLITGRVGLLADLPENPDPSNPVPYIATYIAEAILNWDDAEEADGYNSLNLVVLDESGFKRDQDFNWTNMKKFRVLQLGELEENESVALYTMGAFSDVNGGSAEFNPNLMRPPKLRGATLDQIPFVFINTKDIVPTPDDPPLLGLGRLALAIYRGEADYRQSLFMQGQDTLVVVGSVRNPDGVMGEDDDAIRTGAGSRIDVEMGGDAKYIGVSSTGLSEQRQALENDRKRAETKAGQLISARGNSQESGEALKTRLTAQTATLNQIALAGASGLENLLRVVATWMGANPEEVKVEPNLEFADFDLSGQEIVYLMTARTMGAPISKESIHQLMVDRGITKFDYDRELELIQEEDAGMPNLGTGAGGNPILPPSNRDPNDPGEEEEEEENDE